MKFEAIEDYLRKIDRSFQSNRATEHTYRGSLEELVKKMIPEVEVVNEPKNATDCGNPDYAVLRDGLPIGFVEAKDLGKDLDDKRYKEQFERYRKGLDNLIITDCLEFRFFREGKKVDAVRIAEIDGNGIKPLTENFGAFEELVRAFRGYGLQTIQSPRVLAEIMAAKARLLENILERAVASDKEKGKSTDLKDQYETFKKILIDDLTPGGFADIYAQTLAYGMFAARLYDKNPDSFDRRRAADLIPESNPFLKKPFGHVAVFDVDRRIERTVDNLAGVFRSADVETLLENFGKDTRTEDPVIHFYETFLAEYDPKPRKSRGVRYTPKSVVDFIVRGVDELLKTEFGLPDGLADNSKTRIEVPVEGSETTEEKEVHKVQILDPATGTGTFLASVVKRIYESRFKTMQGAWSDYVDRHLIPRLNGFELLMASYAMAHLTLDLLLKETGCERDREQRLNVYLTNSLGECHPHTGNVFAAWLSNEANEANRIKRDTPVTCVIGNPPYAVSSSNRGDWIEELAKDYKTGLDERNVQPLSDDCVKFIRYGEHPVSKTGGGILAYVSNNGFLDGRIHRKTRERLLATFDGIYVLDLHGSSKKKEAHPDGGKDENVFDIAQGVSVNFFVLSGSNRTSEKKKPAEVFHFDLYGKRREKYDFLDANSLESIRWNRLKSEKPYRFFVKKNFAGKKAYEEGFKVDELFVLNGSGIKTARDQVTVQFDGESLRKIEEDLLLMETEEFRKRHAPKPDGRDWKVKLAKKDLSENRKFYGEMLYRPFDKRKTIYTGKNGIHGPSEARSDAAPAQSESGAFDLQATVHLRFPTRLFVSMRR